jgi:hypothetical protein
VTGQRTLVGVISSKSTLLTGWEDDFKTGVSKIAMGSGWNVLLIQFVFHDSDIIGVILLPEVTN